MSAGPESPRAVNVSHSPLLQPQQQQQTVTSPRQEGGGKQKELLEARRKFSSSLESDVLDYLHYHPAQLEDCVKTLHTIFNNIVTYPDDAKYRRVGSCPVRGGTACWVTAMLAYQSHSGPEHTCNVVWTY